MSETIMKENWGAFFLQKSHSSENFSFFQMNLLEFPIFSSRPSITKIRMANILETKRANTDPLVDFQCCFRFLKQIRKNAKSKNRKQKTLFGLWLSAWVTRPACPIGSKVEVKRLKRIRGPSTLWLYNSEEDVDAKKNRRSLKMHR